MKMFSKTEDGEIDSMLRAQLGRRSDLGSICREFDPDYASAFVERSLTPSEQSRYESHLAACHSCRSGVIALARLADADYSREGAAPLLAPAGARAGLRARLGAWLGLGLGSGLGSGIGGWFGWFGSSGFRQLVPAAAVALIALAVGLPLLVMREDSLPEQAPPISEAASSQERPVKSEMRENQGLTARAKDAGETNAARAATLSGPEPPAADETRAAGAAKEESTEVSEAAAVEQPAPAAPPPTERIDSLMIAEESSRPAPGSVQLPSAPSEPAPTPAPAPAFTPEAEAPKLARIDETNSLRLPGDSKGSAEMIVVKPGVYSGRQSSGRITTATITPRDSIAPPSSSNGDVMRRGLARGNPDAESRARSSSEAARLRGTASRKIGSKTFWLVKGVWTDKKYSPEREQAEITVVRDSDIYNDLLAKHTGLKVFFNAFPSDERVTVVYKETVYKLVPPAK